METYTLIICVFACVTIHKYILQVEKINNTWGKLCTNNIKLLYILGDEVNDNFVGSNYIYLSYVKNNYLSASYKQNLGLKYIYQNYKTDFVFCCGTDTYVNIPKMMVFLNTFNKNDNLLIGGHGGKRKIGTDYVYFPSGGAGFILTYKCLEKIYPLLLSITEDWIQLCSYCNTNVLVSACDVAISFYLQKDNIGTSIIKVDDLSFLACNYKGVPCHKNSVNKKKIITCHFMSLTDFDDFTKILEKNNYFCD